MEPDLARIVLWVLLVAGAGLMAAGISWLFRVALQEPPTVQALKELEEFAERWRDKLTETQDRRDVAKRAYYVGQHHRAIMHIASIAEAMEKMDPIPPGCERAYTAIRSYCDSAKTFLSSESEVMDWVQHPENWEEEAD